MSDRPQQTAAPATPAKQRYCFKHLHCNHARCRATWNRTQSVIRLRSEQGLTNRIPVAEAKAALMQQRKATGDNRIMPLARALGVDYRVIKGIEDGSLQYVQRATLQRLQKPLPTPETVSSTATMLRLRALQAEGWTIVQLADALGCSSALFTRYPVVWYETAVKVVDFVMAAEPGTSRLAGAVARKKGLLPRSAFDQDCLRDPLWDGLGGLITEPTKEDLIAEVRFLAEQGSKPEEIAGRFDIDLKWVRETLRRKPRQGSAGVAAT